MRTIELARKLAERNQKEDAQKAYIIALNEVEGKNPEEELEASSYIFFSEGDYRIALTSFISLYNRGCFQAELMDLMTQAFYLPNQKPQEKQYKNNCTALQRYPYFFGKKFPSFEELPVQFFPFSEEGFVPFFKEENKFGSYVNFNDPVIDRYFFKDLEKPILATDVYSQYQLEYLNDNVRKSEWIGRENHIYLHYTNWMTFCAYLQCLDFKQLLKENKIIVLIEDEIRQYPIDFKERFGIDYSQYPVKPVGIREVKKLIWHTQLSTHNGGDFFNEVFYGHPNLLAQESILFSKLAPKINQIWNLCQKKIHFVDPVLRQLESIYRPTQKDCLVAYFLMADKKHHTGMENNSRIVPAIFFQPHFTNLEYKIKYDSKSGASILYSADYEKIRTSPLFTEFKYIKTFTPMRRFTSSYGATMRYMMKNLEKHKEEERQKRPPDEIVIHLLNRSFMTDPYDRLYRDSVVVRFEDGKLNAKATFTALAEFLDIPYTETMTYCSGVEGMNPESMEGNSRGFDLTPIYRNFDKYIGNAERELLEYFLRDAYEYYGYDILYYHGESVNEAWLKEKLSNISHLDQCTKQQMIAIVLNNIEPFIKEAKSKSKKTDNKTVDVLDEKELLKQHTDKFTLHEDQSDDTELLEEEAELDTLSKEGQLSFAEAIAQREVDNQFRNRLFVTKILLNGLRFVNKEGQPLHMMKPLKLDPALLEQPLYH